MENRAGNAEVVLIPMPRPPLPCGKTEQPVTSRFGRHYRPKAFRDRTGRFIAFWKACQSTANTEWAMPGVLMPSPITRSSSCKRERRSGGLCVIPMISTEQHTPPCRRFCKPARRPRRSIPSSRSFYLCSGSVKESA